MFIGVGGGAKVYTGKEAAEVVKDLNPKLVIPVQYVRGKMPKKNCDQTGIEPFLEAIEGLKSRKVGKTYVIPKNHHRGSTKTKNRTIHEFPFNVF